MRSTNLAMKRLFTVDQWREIEKESKFRTITIDSETKTPICLDADKVIFTDDTMKRDLKVEDIEFASNVTKIYDPNGQYILRTERKTMLNKFYSMSRNDNESSDNPIIIDNSSMVSH